MEQNRSVAPRAPWHGGVSVSLIPIGRIEKADFPLGRSTHNTPRPQTELRGKIERVLNS